MKRYFNIIFWIFTGLILFLVFGISSGNYIHSFYFVSFFLPIIIATSWIFNKILVPDYLLKKRYRKFGLYLFYLIVISLNLEMILVFVALLLMCYYDFENTASILTDFRLMPVVMYFIVIVSGFIALLRQYIEISSSSPANEFIIVRSERKNRKISIASIIYVESMADYIRIIISSNEKIITRETISNLENRLPGNYLRIHRSYIVNTEMIDSYSKEKVVIKGKVLPVSRTYKDRFAEFYG